MKKAFCFDNCAGYFLRKKFVHVWFEISSVTSVDKREPRGTFLSLGLFISRPRPTASASKMRPRLRKTFPRFPFVYFGNLGKTQIRGQKFFLRRVIEKNRTKYYFFVCSAYLIKFWVFGQIKLPMYYKSHLFWFQVPV